MKIILALLIVMALYMILRSALFSLVEKMGIPKRGKILILTPGHSILSALFIWFSCSPLNRDIAFAGIFFTAASLLVAPFTKTRFLSGLKKDEHEIFIEYITPLLKSKTMKFALEEIQDYSLSAGRHWFNKPAIFELITANETIRFYMLEEKTIGRFLS